MFIKNAIAARPALRMLFLIRNKPQACEFVGIAEIAIHSFQTAKAGVSHPGPRVSSTLNIIAPGSQAYRIGPAGALLLRRVGANPLLKTARKPFKSVSQSQKLIPAT